MSSPEEKVKEAILIALYADLCRRMNNDSPVTVEDYDTAFTQINSYLCAIKVVKDYV